MVEERNEAELSGRARRTGPETDLDRKKDVFAVAAKQQTEAREKKRANLGGKQADIDGGKGQCLRGRRRFPENKPLFSLVCEHKEGGGNGRQVQCRLI